MPTDANLPQRIKSIYNTCSPEEQQLLIQILEEISETGHSDSVLFFDFSIIFSIIPKQ